MATDNYLQKPCFKPNIKPYWSTRLSGSHNNMTRARAIWIDNGRQRYSACSNYEHYKSAKSEFRRSHRETIDEHHNKIENELNKTAECDNNAFWNIINQRKRISNVKTGEMVFDGVTFIPTDINCGWKNYFQCLYTPSS